MNLWLCVSGFDLDDNFDDEHGVVTATCWVSGSSGGVSDDTGDVVIYYPVSDVAGESESVALPAGDLCDPPVQCDTSVDIALSQPVPRL